MADSADPVKQPQDWDKCVSVAYLRLLGASMAYAAKATGVGPRSVERWVKCSWWPDALAEAERRWLQDVTAATRRQLLESVKNSDDIGNLLKIAERLIPDMQPSPTKHDVTLTIHQRIRELPRQELERLERLPDNELREELKRLESGG